MTRGVGDGKAIARVGLFPLFMRPCLHSSLAGGVIEGEGGVEFVDVEELRVDLWS